MSSPSASAISTEERYRLLADTMLQGVVHQDADGQIIAMNPAAEKILGKTREEFLGSTSDREEQDTIREDGSVFPGREHPSMIALRTGETVRGVVMGVWRRADQAYRWINVDAVPVYRAGEDRPCEVYAVFEDITERKLSAQALQASEQFIRDVLDSLPEHVIVLDEHGYVRSVNAACMRFAIGNGGTSRTVAPGVNYLEICRRASAEGDNFAAMALRGLEQILAHEREHFVLEYPCHSPQQAHWFMLHAQRMRSSSRGIILSHVEITSQKQTEAALKEADRHKDEFLATLAHELRNPLAPIRSAAEWLKLKAVDDPDLMQSRDVIDRQVSHMARLLEDLLDVSRISRNSLELRLETVTLASVVELALETSHPLIEAGGHELTVQLPQEDLYLRADPMRLAQVFSNLLNNAAKYTEPGGVIELTATRDDQAIVVSVKDNGIGISPEMMPRIFQIFSQASTDLRRSQGGLGIGLSLVKGIAELHHAQVEARSEGHNRGSEFLVRLPLAKEIAVSKHQVAKLDSVTLQSLRILVVDDIKDNADTLAMMLRLLGNEVQQAYGGEEAIAVAQAYQPHIVFLDIGMPQVNGYEAARRIREQAWGASMILVALTGWAREEDRQRTQAAGFDSHLVKPVSAAALMQTIEKWKVP